MQNHVLKCLICNNYVQCACPMTVVYEADSFPMTMVYGRQTTPLVLHDSWLGEWFANTPLGPGPWACHKPCVHVTMMRGAMLMDISSWKSSLQAYGMRIWDTWKHMKHTQLHQTRTLNYMIIVYIVNCSRVPTKMRNRNSLTFPWTKPFFPDQ